MDKIGLALLTMFGVGYIKYAPGTVASLITCVTFYFVAKIVWFQDPYKFFHAYVPFVLFFLFIYSIILIDKTGINCPKNSSITISFGSFFLK